MRFSVSLTILVLTSCLAKAAPFVLDSAQSSVTLSGSVAGSPLREQGDGSLTTTFAGSLEIDLTESTVQILSGTLEAQNNGSWSPDIEGEPGSAPANFGGEATGPFGILIEGAVRDLVLSLESPAIAITAGSFPAEELLFGIAPDSISALDYSAGLFGNDRAFLFGVSTNNAATTGTITTSGDIQTLTINVDTTFYLTLTSQDDTVLRLVGEIVATAQPAPEPTFSNIEIDGQTIRLTVQNGSSTAQIQSSTDLENWTTREPASETIDETTTVYTLPTGAEHEFFRLTL